MTSPKILLVDDQAISRAQVALGLLELGAFSPDEIIEADNGAVGLRAFEKTPTLEHIVIDVHMPVMDGPTMLRMLAGRQPQRVKDTHIVMVTTEDNEQLREQCDRNGVDDWLLKPVDVSALCEYLMARRSEKAA